MTDEAFELNCKVLLDNFSKLTERIINEDIEQEEVQKIITHLVIVCETLKRKTENIRQERLIEATFNFILKPTDLVS